MILLQVVTTKLAKCKQQHSIESRSILSFSELHLLVNLSSIIPIPHKFWPICPCTLSHWNVYSKAQIWAHNRKIHVINCPGIRHHILWWTSHQKICQEQLFMHLPLHKLGKMEVKLHPEPRNENVKPHKIAH